MMKPDFTVWLYIADPDPDQLTGAQAAGNLKTVGIDVFIENLFSIHLCRVY